VDSVKTLTLVLVSVVWSVMMLIHALLPTSPLMEEVIRECVVEQEDIRRETQMLSMHITMKDKQLMVTMLRAYQ